MPNTYSFSKSLAEQVINDHRDQLPVLIVRPSAVYFSSKEPSITWADNIYGTIGPFLGVCFGLIRCIAHKRNLKINNIPSDIAVNAIIAATWETTLTRNVEAGQDGAPVYNLCTPQYLVPTMEDTSLFYTEVGLKPYFRNLGITCSPYVICYSDLWYRINVLFRHVLSSYIIDLLLIICRRQPMLVKIRRKIFILMLLNSFFLSNKFTFATTKLETSMDRMTPGDRITFGWDEEMFDMFKDVCIKFDHLKFTILKPFFDDIKTNTKAIRVLYIVDKFAVCLTYSLVGFFLYYFNIPSLLLSTAVRLVTFP